MGKVIMDWRRYMNRYILVFFVVTIATVNADARAEAPPPSHPSAPRGREVESPTLAESLTQADIPVNLAPEVKALIEGTFAPSAIERSKAAKKLGDLHDRAVPALPFLIRLLRDNERTEMDSTIGVYVDVGYAAVGALIEIGKPSVEPCIAALKQSKGIVQSRLISVLCVIKDPRACEPLVRLLADKDPRVRVDLVASLQFWPDSRFVLPLIGLLKDSDQDVRAAATRALAGNRDARTVSPLIAALQDGDKDVREGAAIALGHQGDHRAAPALLEVLLSGSEDAWVRFKAAVALGKIGEPRTVKAMLSVVQDRSAPEVVRRGAVRGLAASGDRDYVRPLSIFVEDGKEESNVRGEAVQAIADLDGGRAVPFLTQIAKAETQDDHVRCCAAMCVVKLTKGAIEDAGVVRGLEGRYWITRTISEVVKSGEEQEKAVGEIAERGKTESVRAAAKALLKKWRDPSLEDSNAQSEKSPGKRSQN